MTAMRLLLAASLLALLASCAPGLEEAAETRRGVQPQVAIINAPAEERVMMVADALQEELTNVRSCCDFSFARSQPVRFQETHRDMFGSRAAPQAVALAENLGADLAVMASAPRFERTILSLDGAREVEGVVQLRAVVLEVATGASVGTVGSMTFHGSRTVNADEELPELDEDPTMIALTEQALTDLAPHLAAVLSDLVREYRSHANGSSF